MIIYLLNNWGRRESRTMSASAIASLEFKTQLSEDFTHSCPDFTDHKYKNLILQNLTLAGDNKKNREYLVKRFELCTRLGEQGKIHSNIKVRERLRRKLEQRAGKK